MNLLELDDQHEQPTKRQEKVVRQFKDLAASTIEEMFMNAESQDAIGSTIAAEEYSSMSQMDSEHINLPCPNFSMAVYQPHSSLRADSLCKPFVAVGGQDCIVRIYSLESDNSVDDEGVRRSPFQPMMQLSGHTGAITSIKVYQPKGQNVVVVVTGSRDHSVRVWVIQTKECYRELRGHKAWVVCLDVFQPSDLEPLVVGGDLEGTILVWSMLRGEVYRRFESAGTTAVTSLVAYLPKNETPQILAGNEDASINLWSLASGDIMQTLNAHTGAITSLDILYNYGGAVSEDCTDRDQVLDIIVSGSMDKTINIWSAKTAVILRTITCHNAAVISVKLVPIHTHPKVTVSTEREGKVDTAAQAGPTPSRTVAAKVNSKDNKASPDSDDDDEDEENKVKVSSAGIAADLSDDLKKIFSSLGDVAAAAIKGGEQDAVEDFADVAFMEYVHEVAVISTGKDARICVTSLNTGGSLYTLNHHRGPVTGVGTYVVEDDADDLRDVPLLKFFIPGRQNLKLISIGIDKKLAICKLQSFRKSAYDAYTADKNGFHLPVDIINIIPDEFRPWANVYNQSLETGQTIDEYFSHESFALFQQAILDNRPDFIELFLKKCPNALAASSHWSVVVHDVSVRHSEVKATNRDSDDDTAPSASFSHHHQPSQFRLKSTNVTENAMNATTAFDRYISPLEDHAKSLLIGSIKESAILDDASEQKKRYALHGILIENNEVPASAGCLKRWLHSLNQKARARTYKKKRARPIANTFSLLAVALEKRDVRSVTAILSVWLTICNAPKNKSWIDQVAGSFTRLRIEVLIQLADLYPVVFQNFICDLKLQPVHPNVILKNTTKISWTKEFKKKGSVGHIQNDVQLWHDRKCTEFQPMNVGFYIPLAHCADFAFVECLSNVSTKVGDIRLFESEVGSVVIRYLWSNAGNDAQKEMFSYNFFYALSVNIFALTTSMTFSTVPLSYVFFRRLYEFREIVWSNDIWYLARPKSILALAMDTAIILPTYYRLTNPLIAKSNVGPPFYRWYLSIVIILINVTLVSRLRPFHSTGPIIATIVEIIKDIRSYLVILTLMMLSFSVTFWTLCSSNMQSPFEVPASAGCLKRWLHSLNQKARARTYKKKRARPIANTFSLLAVALEKRDVRSAAAGIHVCSCCNCLLRIQFRVCQRG